MRIFFYYILFDKVIKSVFLLNLKHGVRDMVIQKAIPNAINQIESH